MYPAFAPPGYRARSDIRGRFPLCDSDYLGFFAYFLCVCIRVHLDSGYSLLYRENIVVKIKTKFLYKRNINII